LAKLHGVPFKTVGLEKFGKPGGYYTRQIKTFKTISEAQAATQDIKTGKKVGPVPHFNHLLDWFGRNLPFDRTTIVHGDYKLDNMVHPQDELRIGLSSDRTACYRVTRLGTFNHWTSTL
jgi:aminoglycoside phosphotransferase (APT) family kinase protein